MKKTRHEKIMEIIRESDVGTQEELAGRLKEAGFAVTQATVSRDIRELKLSKVAAAGGQRYVAMSREDALVDDKYSRVLRDAFSSAATAQNLLVIKTVSGMAMAVAAALDAMSFPEIVGSIAGDDTIFVAAGSAEEAGELMEKIHSLISA